MRGYWKRPDATRAALSEEGWLRTGDAARSDEEGFVWIVDRVTDAICLRDETIFPGDVERVLIEHPAVADVAVIQTPGVDRLVAFVVVSDGGATSEDEIVTYGREHLAAHRAPGAVVFLDELPRNSVGKLVRAELRTLASATDSP